MILKTYEIQSVFIESSYFMGISPDNFQEINYLKPLNKTSSTNLKVPWKCLGYYFRKISWETDPYHEYY